MTDASPCAKPHHCLPYSADGEAPQSRLTQFFTQEYQPNFRIHHAAYGLLPQAVNRRFRPPDDVTELGGFAAVAKAVA